MTTRTGATDTEIAGIPGQMAFDVDDGVDAEAASAALVRPLPLADDRPPALRRVWIRRFKSFNEFSVDLGRFNVLVGANNAGKSTLLQAIDLLYTLLKLHRENDGLSSQGRYLPAPVLPVASMKDLFYRREIRQGRSLNLAVEIGAEFTDNSSVEFGIRHLFGSMNSRVQHQVGMRGDRLAALLSHPAVWVPSAVGIVRDEEYRTLARRAALINAGRHNEILRNLLVELNETRPDRYEWLQRTLEERFNASLEDVGFDNASDEYVRASMALGRDVSHDLYSAGSGFVQIVQLLAFVLVQNPSVVLLDEPDAHLHSSLQRAIVEILEDIGREQRLQIIVATHSKEIINFIDPTRLIFVQPGQRRAAPMTAEVTPMAVLRSLGAIDNVDAFALVKNRRCLFVEGTSDVSILGRFATTLGIRAFSGDDRVVVIPTGGSDRFGHVQQLDVFEQLLAAPIASVEIRDRDARMDDDRTAIARAAQRPLFVFERDSIESYLLEPGVVARVVIEVADERGTKLTVTAEDVRAMLLRLTEDLKDTTIKRVGERYLEHARREDGKTPSFSRITDTATAFVDRNWESLDDRLRIVSGKRLLGVLRAAIQDEYRVNFGNERLAEGFTAEEIPAEVIEVLKLVDQLEAPVSNEAAEGD